MAGKLLRFELNKAGVRELLTSGEMRSAVMARARAVAAQAGPGHDVQDTTTNRARATVMTDTYEAMVEEGRNRTLTRALNAARG